MEGVSDDNGVLEHTQTDIPKPVASYAQELAHWKKDTTIFKRIILDGVRDHVVSNLYGKGTPFAIWKTLTDLFQSSNDVRKLELRDKLKSFRIQKNETIPEYLSIFTQVQDELGGVG